MYVYSSSLSGGRIVYNQLKQVHKVKHAFIYSGGAIMPLIDCFYNGEIKYHINTHEQNCTIRSRSREDRGG